MAPLIQPNAALVSTQAATLPPVTTVTPTSALTQARAAAQVAGTSTEEAIATLFAIDALLVTHAMDTMQLKSPQLVLMPLAKIQALTLAALMSIVPIQQGALKLTVQLELGPAETQGLAA